MSGTILRSRDCKSNSAALLKSKYRVSPILYRRYFFNIGEGIANTFEKSIGRSIANTFLAVTFYRYFFLYYIGFNGLPQFAELNVCFPSEERYSRHSLYV